MAVKPDKAEKRLRILLSDLRYEFDFGIHTCHQCECGRNSTRRGPCWQCLVEEYLKGGV